MTVLPSIRRGLLGPVSAVGLLVAVMFFGLSVTPSMVPRSPELQGALGGVIAALGYLIWWLAARLLAWLGLRSERRVSRPGRIVLMLVSAVIAVVFLWKAADWQNSIQHVWGLAPLEASAPLRVATIAVAVFVILLVAGRLFRGLAKRLQARSLRVLPPRMAQAAGMGLAVLVFAATIDGVAVRGVLRTIDTGARLADAIIPPDLAPPDTTHVSGGPGSLLDWEDLGRWGRNFVASGPTAAEITDFWNAPARQPIRIYTGLNAAETPDARAQRAFDELLRAGGFDRQVLVIAMPTGSGWLDPAGWTRSIT